MSIKCAGAYTIQGEAAIYCLGQDNTISMPCITDIYRWEVGGLLQSHRPAKLTTTTTPTTTNQVLQWRETAKGLAAGIDSFKAPYHSHAHTWYWLPCQRKDIRSAVSDQLSETLPCVSHTRHHVYLCKSFTSDMTCRWDDWPWLVDHYKWSGHANLEGSDHGFLVHALHGGRVVVVGELVKRSKSVPCNLRNKGFNFYRPSKGTSFCCYGNSSWLPVSAMSQ